ncbi:endonuclease/exonuclease/phosphatase family protein [Commensalibacter nepenthis]|uniref:Endonuclease/exonuclease/phosphatase family protein n=1 Tax=Commensalibacter nepenthis TaxID=3043872 RepID=A0ABT6Q609_9PROT|nr:endonuclease/exonuclease/phosphatase family protein [Commensalibacter sp. TBRC 10068]MDI2112325.1 endonuclease/exonuclease/phosphatase family protein [Commensalibacter sp. TBRC 10068]
MYKKICFCIFYTLLFFTTDAVQAATIKLTTWNIEWLVSEKDIQNTPIPHNVNLRKSDDFGILQRYVIKLHSDIIALQEIGSLETLNSIFPANDYVFFISKDFIAQHTALAVRKNMIEHIEQNTDLTALSTLNESHPLRSGLDVTLYTRGHNSLRILVLHLKSGCQDYPLTHKNLKAACRLLKKQLPILQEWVQKRLEKKQAFIILGDFNRIISPNDFFFQSLSEKMTTPTFPTAYQASPCWGGGYFIDGFILDQNAAQWFIPNSLRVLRYQEQDYAQQNQLSDHCPVSITLSIP